MTNSLSLKTLMTCFCLLMISAFSYSQVQDGTPTEDPDPIRTPRHHWGYPMMMQPGGDDLTQNYTPEEPCVMMGPNGEMKIKVFINFATNNFTNVHLPIWLRYNIDGILVGDKPHIIPNDLTEITYYAGTEHEVTVYQVKYTFELNYAESCSHEQDFFNIPFSFKLMTQWDGGSSEPVVHLFPVQNFRGTNQIFDANIIDIVTNDDTGDKWVCCVEYSGEPGSPLLGHTETELSPQELMMSNSKNVDASENQLIQTYPNPFRDQLVIDSNGPTMLYVTDLNGRTVFRSDLEGGSKVNIDTRDWHKGMYIMHLEEEGVPTIRKIIKN